LEGRVEQGMCLVPERRELFTTMTVSDNLELGGFLRTAQERWETLDEVYQLFPRLEGAAAADCRHAVGRRAADAGARPRADEPSLGCLLLDEPSLGPGAKDRRGNSGDGVAVAPSPACRSCWWSRTPAPRSTIADYAYLVELGEVRREGPAAELAADPKLAETYLGGSVE
jgi:branched-chain amino acid transport system ATP-binding protein